MQEVRQVKGHGMRLLQDHVVCGDCGSVFPVRKDKAGDLDRYVYCAKEIRHCNCCCSRGQRVQRN